MKLRIVTAVVAVLTLATASAASAQPRAERPYRGLFGGGFSETTQSLTANASLGAGWDQNVLLGSGLRRSDTLNPRNARSGEYGIGSAGLNYALQRGVFNLGASAVSTTRYYPNLVFNEFVRSHRGSVNASFTFGRTRFWAGQSLAYQPYNLVSLLFLPPAEGLADVVELPDEDLSISPFRYTSNATTAGVSHSFPLGRRGTVGLAYDYARVDVSTRPDVFWRQGASARYTHALTRGLNAYVGYYMYDVWYPRGLGQSRHYRVHNADAGIDFNRALSMSLSRRVTLTFTTGSSAFVRGNEDNVGRRYRLNGTATLNREVGRTWNARVGYVRGVSFVETFDNPFLYDSVYASYSGLLNRRLRFASRVGASFGNVGLSGRSPYEAYNGRANLDYAVSRFVSTGVSYSYSRYTFRGTTRLPDGSLPFADRQGVRAYVTAWAPLFTRIRRADAPG